MRKKEIWVDIAGQLMKQGFRFKNPENAWEKVSQKWRNMERTYRVYITNNKKNGGDSTGKGIEFFDELHALLAQKYVNAATLVQDLQIDHDMPSSSGHSNENNNGEEVQDPLNTFMYPAESESFISMSAEDSSPPLMPIKEEERDEDEIPPAATTDSVVQLLIEMQAEERVFWRQDRIERFNLQREFLDFRREMMDLFRQQHQEKMDAIYALVSAINQSNNRKRPRDED